MVGGLFGKISEVKMLYELKKPRDLEIIGIGILNINDSASLVTKCLYCEGEIDLGDKEYEISLFSEELEEALKSHTERFVKIFVEAIQNKTLEARLIRRRLDESIITEETYINTEDLVNWLEERKISLGDLYYDIYFDFQYDLTSGAESYVKNTINIKKYPNDYKEFKEKSSLNPDSFFSEYIENYKLSNRENKSNNFLEREKPLHKKEKESLLKLFIGMAICNYGLESISSNDVKASEISKDIRLNSGIDIDDDTVRKYLKKGLEVLKKYD